MLAFVAVSALGFAGLTSCGSDDDNGGGDAGSGGSATGGSGGGDAGSGGASGVSTIKIAQNNWLSSKINTEIARKIMTEEMDLDVEVSDEDASGQFAKLADGEVHVCLEIWASGRKEQITDYVDTGKVEDGGELGARGKIGWFTPSYMIEKYPSLETWKALEDPAILAEFATPETDPKGRFLGAVEGYSSYDQQIIDNLGLDLEIIPAKSEEDALTQLEEAVNAEKAILMYWWLPHSSHAIYDLTNVKLPEHTAECYAKSDEGGVDCDYPTDYLFKVFWPELKNEAPEAYQFLKSLELDTKTQIELMAEVDYKDKTVEEACAGWVAENKPTWETWLP